MNSLSGLPDAVAFEASDGAAQAIPDTILDVCADLCLQLGADQLSALRRYLALLQRWNGTYNLTAVRSPEGMLTQHLADCLAIVPPFQRELGAGSRLLDVGSGGGLPGVILAICQPVWDVSCVDAVAKKAAFVRQAGGELNLPNLHAMHGRVEALKLPSFDLITSRAFGSLADFVRLTRSHLSARGVWVAMKAKLPRDEITDLPTDIDVFHVEPIRVPGMDAERCLVWMRHKPPNQDD